MRNIFNVIFENKIALIILIKIVILAISITSLSSRIIINEYEDLINVETFHERDEKITQYIKSELAKGIVSFQSEIKCYPDIEITIFVSPNKRTYDEWVSKSNVKILNSIAFADLNKTEIYIQNPRDIRNNKKFINSLLHEYIHIYIHYHFYDAPLWLHEGLAWFYAENISLNQTFQFMMNNAFHTNYLLIKYAYDYPNNISNIEPFYFQSAMLARKINEEYKNQLHKLFDLSYQKHSFTQSFMTAFQMSDIEFLRYFENELQLFFRLNVYKGMLLLAWICFPVFLIIAKFQKNRKTRKILEEWEAESSCATGAQLSETTVSDDSEQDIYQIEKIKSEGIDE